MIGRTLSHFRILAKIGEGGMGIVYRAEDEALRRTVALKVLPPNLTSDPERRLRFLREARAAAAVTHPNIATVYEVGEAEGVTFIAMELVEGKTLREVIGARTMAAKEALRAAVQIAEGLACAHRAGVVHRDLKPENVMLGADGRPRILDFGLAKLLEDRPRERIRGLSQVETLSAEVTREGKILGTPAYMSPEQIEGKPVDVRSDVFSFGAVLYEMLSGHRAFKGDSPSAVFTAILRDSPPPLRPVAAGVPSDLERVVRRCLEKRPESRYPSGDEVWKELSACQARLVASDTRLRRFLRRPRALTAAAAVILAAAGAAAWLGVLASRARWAREEAVPEIARLLGKDQYVAAFLLAREAQRYLPDDPDIRRAIANMSVPTSILTTPAGADLYFKSYRFVDAEWVSFGRAPLENVLVPGDILRWRVEKQGFDTLDAAVLARPEAAIHFTLEPEGTAPPGMARVPAGEYERSGGSAVALEEYWIDKHEVTNRKFNEFIADGGYQKREHWKVPFARNGQPVPWQRAMAQFRDTTGRPGPATWKLGTFPEGEADHPVRGISWYEAAAYCESAGKSLPTVYHWYRAADLGASSDIILLSNFGGKGPASVGSHPGLGRYGTYDMAGNVKEWCWNETGNRRYILGGAWSEPNYMFADEDAHAPFNRSETFGVRCVRYGGPLPETLTAPIPTLSFDYSKEKPAGDEAFRVYKGLYAYDRESPLNARVDSVDETAEHWRHETISFGAGYGNERVVAHLYLPRHSSPPYQAVIYFPGSYALEMKSSDPDPQMGLTDFIPRSGRALLCPVYKGTYERRAPSPPSWPYGWRDLVIQWGKELGRSIDYLETRQDIDSKRLAFYGLSMGAAYGPLFCALEERLRASVLLGGGFDPSDMSGPPEINPYHFAPRARTPTLMINGRQDFLFPLEARQLPMFRLLGAPEHDKRHALYDGGHLPPIEFLIKETLDWLDRCLGEMDRGN